MPHKYHEKNHTTTIDDIQVVEKEWHNYRRCKPPCPCKGHRQTEVKYTLRGQEISIDDLLEKLANEISEASQEIKTIKNRVKSKNQELLRLQDELVQKEAHQRNLENNISNLSQENRRLNANINMRQGELVKIQNDNERIRQRIEMLERNIQIKQNEISGLENHNNMVARSIESLKAQIANLEAQRAHYQEEGKRLGKLNEEKKEQIKLQIKKNKNMKEILMSKVDSDMDFDTRMFYAEQIAKMQGLNNVYSAPTTLQEVGIDNINQTQAELHYT